MKSTHKEGKRELLSGCDSELIFISSRMFTNVTRTKESNEFENVYENSFLLVAYYYFDVNVLCLRVAYSYWFAFGRLAIIISFSYYLIYFDLLN